MFEFQLFAFIINFAHFSDNIVMSKSTKIAEKTEFSGSKLYELLKGFTKEELKRFGLFIKSPYFNKSKIMEVLYG